MTQRQKPLPRGALLLLLLAARCFAQRPFPGTLELTHALDRLDNTGSALLLAAHPDDENTAILAWLARGVNARTAYLSLTRGEGGQNLIGPEQGTLLGVIRTQELKAARRIDGGEQFFSSAVDFGYTKSAEETLHTWDREKVLGEIVGIIREFQPDVILLSFSGTPKDGHGQHQASAILAKEAFSAAADPKRFPEQLTRLQPWRAKRLIWTPWWGEGLPPHQKVDIGQYNPELGYSYNEIAALSRSMHRSQSMGVPQQKGTAPWALVPVAGEPMQSSIFDGIDLSWNRVPGGAPVGALLAKARQELSPKSPEKIVPLLFEVRRAIEALPPSQLRDRKLRDTDSAIVLAAGLWLDATVPSATVVAGDEITVTAEALVRSPLPVALRSVTFNQTVLKGETLTLNKPFTTKGPWHVPADHTPTQTWSPEAGTGEAPPVLTATFSLTVDGQPLSIERPVVQRYVDHEYGERIRPLSIVPPVSVRLPESSLVFPDAKTRNVTVEVQANKAGVSGDAELLTPDGWRVTPASQKFSLARLGEQANLVFTVQPPDHDSRTHVTAKAAGISVESRAIEYPHILAQRVMLPAAGEFVRLDVKTLAHQIGYVMGSGDPVPRALEQIGCTVTLLTSSDLTSGDLSRFDAIITGVRAFNTRTDLAANMPRLLEYVRAGGTLVEQYNVLERGGPASFPLGPYPIQVGRERVSVENVPVKILNPSSALLNEPNRITPADWDGWIQERGLYFPSSWDAQYQTLVETNDPGEKPLAGGILYTKYGRGAYVFTAFSWFRELPAGVPGAYRIFANLISSGKTLSSQ